jgi:hypothetical protein
MHEAMAATLDAAVKQVKQIQQDARVHSNVTRPRWPMTVGLGSSFATRCNTLCRYAWDWKLTDAAASGVSSTAAIVFWLVAKIGLALTATE